MNASATSKFFFKFFNFSLLKFLIKKSYKSWKIPFKNESFHLKSPQKMWKIPSQQQIFPHMITTAPKYFSINFSLTPIINDFCYMKKNSFHYSSRFFFLILQFLFINFPCVKCTRLHISSVKRKCWEKILDEKFSCIVIYGFSVLRNDSHIYKRRQDEEEENEMMIGANVSKINIIIMGEI